MDSEHDKSAPQTFTGRRGRHQTRWTVKAADQISTAMITVGGIGTIVSVSLVFVALLAVVWPLFRSASVGDSHAVTAPSAANQAQASLLSGIDEYQSLCWRLFPDGTFHVTSLRDGSGVTRESWCGDGTEIVAIDGSPITGQIAYIDSNHALHFRQLEFETSFPEESSLPASVREIAADDAVVVDGAIVEWTTQGQLRQQRLKVTASEPLELTIGSVRRLALGEGSQGPVVLAVSEDGSAHLVTLRERRNLMTRKTTLQATVHPLPPVTHGDSICDFVVIPGRADNLYLIWSDGHLVRIDARSPANATLAETLSLLPSTSAARITTATLAIGNETLLVGDSEGTVRAWFRSRHPQATTPDGMWLLPVHELSGNGSEVTDVGISHRSRMAAVSYADQTIRVFHATTARRVCETRLPFEQPVDKVLFAPKDDGLVAVAANSLWQADFDPAYPEATFSSLFRNIWYEGYDRPDVVWQSSFAGVQSEMKLGLVPLIFGTVKATFYSMLFGAPLALLAAIYTSEFLSPKLRTQVKSVIEVMASLPSVVLGFLGGLVIAPIVERFVPVTLSAFVAIPLCMLGGAFLWQLLPSPLAIRFRSMRLWLIGLAIPIGALVAWSVGPLVEAWLFAGDIMLWLDGQTGTGTGAWLMLLLPLCGMAAAAISILFVNPWLASVSRGWSRRQFAMASLLKFAVAVAATFLMAFAIATILSLVQLDPRGTFVGTYVQRNSLVVGFVMGFAIIPIIYTISEDALSTVPQHLRSASLGAGATPWQTAVRIVVPTAMSGLFSAIMIGLGRAVGETMIVLMAAGNTPVMEWNLFNGFRTLSANIAVELPEAVRDSTHYRTLFLAALTLLVLTFAINTLAELVRLRFRKRAVNL